MVVWAEPTDLEGVDVSRVVVLICSATTVVIVNDYIFITRSNPTAATMLRPAPGSYKDVLFIRAVNDYIFSFSRQFRHRPLSAHTSWHCDTVTLSLSLTWCQHRSAITIILWLYTDRWHIKTHVCCTLEYVHTVPLLSADVSFFSFFIATARTRRGWPAIRPFSIISIRPIYAD